MLRRGTLVQGDYLSYIDYVKKLEALRDMRNTRMLAEAKQRVQDVLGDVEAVKEAKKELSKLKGNQSMYHHIVAQMIRHVAYIYDQLTRRFPGDISMWMSNIEYLQARGSRTMLNTVYGRMLSLHPKCEDVWLESARHELKLNQNSYSVRVLLQRALRFNYASERIWLYYFNFEIWNATRIKDRKRLLDLDTDNTVLLGAPLIVVKHALNSINHVQFGIKLYDVAHSVSDVLSAKVEEVLMTKFPNSEILVEHFLLLKLGCNIQSFEESDSEGSLQIEERYIKGFHSNVNHVAIRKTAASDILSDSLSKINHAMEYLNNVENNLTNIMEEEQKVQWLDMLLRCLHIVCLRIGFDVSLISEKSLNYLTKKQKLGDTILDDIIHKNVEGWTEFHDMIAKLADVLSHLYSKMRTYQSQAMDVIAALSSSKNALSTITINSTSVRVIYNIGELLKLCGISTKKYEKSSFVKGNDIPYSVHNYDDMNVVILWMKDVTKNIIKVQRELYPILTNALAQKDESLDQVMQKYCDAVIFFVSRLESKIYSDNFDMKELSDVCKVFIDGGNLEILISNDRGLKSLSIVYDILVHTFQEYAIVEMSMQKLIHSENIVQTERLPWIMKYFDFMSTCRVWSNSSYQHGSIEKPLGASRENSIEAFRTLEKLLNNKPHLLVYLKGLDDLFKHSIVVEELYLATGASTEKESYEQFKTILETALRFERVLSNVKSFYEIYVDIERRFGEPKRANHLRWKMSQI